MNANQVRYVLSAVAVATLLNTAPVSIASPSADVTPAGEQVDASHVRVNLSADGLQYRTWEAAVIAGAAYDSPSTVTYAGRTFSPVIKLLRDCVRTYRYDDPSTLAIIVAFRGTVDWGDILLDLRGAAKMAVNPQNPLTNLAEPGSVGSGFYARPYNYLKKYGAEILHAVTVARMAKRRVEVIVIGHSLGGIAAEFGAFWFSRALQMEHPGDTNIVVTNHAFNSPRGTDRAFRAAYEAEVVAGRLNSVSVIRSHDAVSKLNVVTSFRGIDIAESGKVAGFKASEHSIKLPAKTWLWSTQNHSIDVMADDVKLVSDDPLKLYPLFVSIATKYATNLPPGDSDRVVGVCGNGILNTGEQCDDGNTASGDRCSGTCKLEQFNAGCHECWSWDSTIALP